MTQDKRNEISGGYDNYEGLIDDVGEEEKANTEELKTVIETDKHIMERLLGKVQELIDKNKKKVDELIQDYDDAARNRLTYSQYQKWKVIEAVRRTNYGTNSLKSTAILTIFMMK
ncbi:MAG: hypothetical protein WCF23_02380 [Candidatus Nitrosopolaris sp.]